MTTQTLTELAARDVWEARFPFRLHRTTTLLDSGTYHHEELGPFPAFRTTNSIYGQEWVWAFTGRRQRKGRFYGPPIFVENHNPDERYAAHLQEKNSAE